MSPPWSNDEERLRYLRERQDRVRRLRSLLASFQREQPFIDNVAHRIIAWAEDGFRGKP